MKKHLAIFGMIFFSGALLIFNPAYALKKRPAHQPKTASYNSSPDSVSANEIIDFAQTLIGTRYRSASSSPVNGFDCSGFVSYVFKNFNFNVPRSSGDFAAVGEKIKLTDAKPGDIILFRGLTKSKRIGHIGILVSNGDNEVTFIHSTSGKEHGVTITTMDDHYKKRFVEVVRLLKQNTENYLLIKKINPILIASY